MLPDNEKRIVPTSDSGLRKAENGEWEIMTGVGQYWGPKGPSWTYEVNDQPPQLRIPTLNNIPFEELPKICQKAIEMGYGVGIDELDNFVIFRQTPQTGLLTKLPLELLPPKG